jgi:AcrR family transcriptional regulator
MDEAGPDLEQNGWERRRERISREIEQAALELFAEFGTDDVTIEQIAAASGVSKRTFFRYFATRDDVLTALPTRALAQMSALVSARPRGESVIEAFTAAGLDADSNFSDRDLRLLWGKVVQRSPEAAARAMSHSAVSLEHVFRTLVADRLGIPDDDPRAAAVGAAVAGVTGFTYRRWVEDEGQEPLGKRLAAAFEALSALDTNPSRSVGRAGGR